jgi:acetyl esterase
MPRRSLNDRLMYIAARSTAWLPSRVQVALSGQSPITIDGQQLDPQLQLLLALRRRRTPRGLVEPTVEAGRRRYRREAQIYGPHPTPVGSVREFDIPGADGPLRARHYRPEAAASAPLTVYFHGGGFVIGDLDTHDEPCRFLCRHAGTHVLSVAYRLAPEHPFPAAVDDAAAAFRWARANAESLGADPRRVAVGGDSGGANLSAVVALEEAPWAQLLLYPPTDGVTSYASRTLFDGFFLTTRDRTAFSDAYLGGRKVRDQIARISPLYASRTAPLAPAVVVVAGFDILRDEVEAYARALSDCGTSTRVERFPALGHGFIHLTTVCTAARLAMLQIAHAWSAVLDRAIV